ncbi:hypothetical protein BEL04_08900 [Mucilaginibacter sp. PPCGB 2223]|uniref:hypothetical protein n=1 Tax=Mucilaginibacter sp. PPCGB 2223 TaxID=1886027 RepID=UPI000858CAAC|nr:hypothetical protein [Mucilaginibacter sp. PPCGB 2223]OCX54365.1 hypothetical protein BEL04_08900 [Mucilaginibacter sp. PPCGB 2223]
MRGLTVKLQAMLDELRSNLTDEDLLGWRKSVELFQGCAKWRTAYALERRRLVEIWRNENEQVFVFLSGKVFI